MLKCGVGRPSRPMSPVLLISCSLVLISLSVTSAAFVDQSFPYSWNCDRTGASNSPVRLVETTTTTSISGQFPLCFQFKRKSCTSSYNAYPKKLPENNYGMADSQRRDCCKTLSDSVDKVDFSIDKVCHNSLRSIRLDDTVYLHNSNHVARSQDSKTGVGYIRLRFLQHTLDNIVDKKVCLWFNNPSCVNLTTAANRKDGNMMYTIYESGSEHRCCAPQCLSNCPPEINPPSWNSTDPAPPPPPPPPPPVGGADETICDCISGLVEYNSRWRLELVSAGTTPASVTYKFLLSAVDGFCKQSKHRPGDCCNATVSLIDLPILKDVAENIVPAALSVKAYVAGNPSDTRKIEAGIIKEALRIAFFDYETVPDVVDNPIAIEVTLPQVGIKEHFPCPASKFNPDGPICDYILRGTKTIEGNATIPDKYALAPCCPEGVFTNKPLKADPCCVSDITRTRIRIEFSNKTIVDGATVLDLNLVTVGTTGPSNNPPSLDVVEPVCKKWCEMNLPDVFYFYFSKDVVENVYQVAFAGQPVPFTRRIAEEPTYIQVTDLMQVAALDKLNASGSVLPIQVAIFGEVDLDEVDDVELGGKIPLVEYSYLAGFNETTGLYGCCPYSAFSVASGKVDQCPPPPPPPTPPTECCGPCPPDQK